MLWAYVTLNGVGKPLYCLMVEDGFGHSRVVHYATTSEEDTEHLWKIVQSFKDENSARSYIRVIVKAMFKKMVDFDVEKCERNNVRGILRQLVYSKVPRSMKM